MRLDGIRKIVSDNNLVVIQDNLAYKGVDDIYGFCTSILATIEEYYKKHTVENNLTCENLNLT